MIITVTQLNGITLSTIAASTKKTLQSQTHWLNRRICSKRKHSVVPVHWALGPTQYSPLCFSVYTKMLTSSGQNYATTSRMWQKGLKRIYREERHT